MCPLPGNSPKILALGIGKNNKTLDMMRLKRVNFEIFAL